MPKRSAPFFFFFFFFAIFVVLTLADDPRVDENRSPSDLRDASIREALVSISTGKLPTNDDRLIELITEDIKDAARKASDQSQGIEAAARQAQEAVSEITAAYTAVIFRSTSVAEAGRLFGRFEKTIDKIVDFAKNGSFAV